MRPHNVQCNTFWSQSFRTAHSIDPQTHTRTYATAMQKKVFQAIEKKIKFIANSKLAIVCERFAEQNKLDGRASFRLNYVQNKLFNQH